jgi:RimJ/RimL family protein N-acetyltransferase
MLTAPATLDTPRVHLRQPRLEDARAIFDRYARDPEVVRYMTWRAHQTLDETRAFLERCQAVWRDGSAFPWLMVARADAAVLGMVEARVRLPSVDLGYGMARAAWGQGLMTECVQAVVAWAFAQPEVFRVWATCDVDNVRSARVLERVGMQHEGILRRWIVHPNVSSEPRDSHCYARVR